MGELRVLLIFHERDVGSFHGRHQGTKMKMEHVGWREKTWRERCGIIDQLDARLNTVFCVKFCHESVLLLHLKTVQELGIL